MRDEEQSPPDDADAPAAKQSIGETLRATREFRRASIEYVSELLRIEPRFLAALEEDRFDAIGPPVFVKGYVKHYAELLGLDPRPLLDELRERLGREEPVLQARRSAEQVKERSGGNAAVGIGAVAIAAVVLAVVAAWQLGWLGGLGSGREEGAEPDEVVAVDTRESSAARRADASTSAPSTQVQQRLELPAAPASSNPPAVGDGAPSNSNPPAVGDAAPSSPNRPAVGEPASSSSNRPAVGDAAPSDEAVGATVASSSVGTVLSASAAAEGAAEPRPSVADRAEATAVSVAEEPAAGRPSLEIELRFVEDSWTEITSAGGDRLFYGLGRAGLEERIRAEDQVRVLLGNADGVVVRVNGEPFAYPAGSRSGDLARFRLSPSN